MLVKLWVKLKRFRWLHAFIKYLTEFVCDSFPALGRIFYNMGISPDRLDFGSGDMPKDWDSRARTNAKWYIYRNGYNNDEEFNATGEQEVREVVLKDILLNSDVRVLEIGCGIGRLLKPLSGYVKEAYGVDISQEMILQGQKRLESYQNVFLSVCDGTLSAFQDNYFDLCYSLAVFRHIPEKKYIYRYFQEVSRILKSGGIFRFEVCSAGFFKSRDKGGTIIGVSFKKEEIYAELKEYGFEVLVSEKIPKLPYTIYTAMRGPKCGIEPTQALTWSRGRQQDK